MCQWIASYKHSVKNSEIAFGKQCHGQLAIICQECRRENDSLSGIDNSKSFLIGLFTSGICFFSLQPYTIMIILPEAYSCDGSRLSTMLSKNSVTWNPVFSHFLPQLLSTPPAFWPLCCSQTQLLILPLPASFALLRI